MAFYQALKATGGPILKAAYRPWIRGKENIPAEGPAILASNHNAVWDSVFLPMMLDREVVFMGKADYFTGTGFKGWVTKEFMRAVGTIPVDRSGGRASEAALNAGLKRLREGELFGIYPEGTRSPDGRLYRGKTGVARLALLSGAPVIPVAMIGTHAAQPIGQRIPSRTNIGMVIGEPLDFSRYKGLHKDRYVLRAITDEIMYNLMLLSGQEYVDLYAADVKAKMAEEGEFDGPVPSNGRAAPGGRIAPEVEVPGPPEDDADSDSADDQETPEAAEGSEAPASVEDAAPASDAAPVEKAPAEEKAPAPKVKADSESVAPASDAAPVEEKASAKKATPTKETAPVKGEAPAAEAEADSDSPAPASDAAPVEEAVPVEEKAAPDKKAAPAKKAPAKKAPAKKAAPAAEAEADSESPAPGTGEKASGAKRKKSAKRKKR
ncbi:acyltransferase [Schaalia georgiae F0490]|uniref:Acyltransferase n=1 Tax=Schaalia georgiae F0490 TaxID=1125717 RepID=J1HYU3_9ACTO|nr:acyltransferase [Schaalia georgiae F0490]